MKKIFKRIIAAVIATASLATGMLGMGASAADVTTPVEPEIIARYQGPETDISFGGGAHARAYADSQQINLTTEAQNSNINALVRLNSTSYKSLFDVNGNNATDDVARNYTNRGVVYLNYYGSGIKYAEGYHEANGYSQTTYRSIG